MGHHGAPTASETSQPAQGTTGMLVSVPCRHLARAPGSVSSSRINIYQLFFPLPLIQRKKPVCKRFYFIREFFCFSLFF